MVGSRGFSDYLLLREELDHFVSTHDVYCIVSGGAIGADTLAERYAYEKGIRLVVYPAKWNTDDGYDKHAGFTRNKKIIDYADVVYAFWDNASKGTRHSIDLTKKAGKPLKVIDITPSFLDGF